MSTELVAIERINIKKDNGDADALRSCLAHYLQQFLDSASIESMTLHELTIRIDGESVLNVSDKTGGVVFPVWIRIGSAQKLFIKPSSKSFWTRMSKCSCPMI